MQIKGSVFQNLYLWGNTAMQNKVLKNCIASKTRFIDNLAENAVSDGESSADELMALPSLKSELPEVVLVAHNGMRLDFAMLLSECCRCSLPLGLFTRWKYADTLDVARAACSTV